MPIKGKTDIASLEKSIDLQVVYRLWKGEPKSEKSAGRDLKDRFRFEGSDRSVAKFQEFYGTLNPEYVRIFLPYEQPDQCLETWMESYQGGNFKHRCDGERIIEQKVQKEYKDYKGKTNYTWRKEACDRPCIKVEQNLEVCPDCGKTGKGRLFFYVQELYQAGMGSTKCGMMSLNGDHDLGDLPRQLHALYQRYGSLCSSPVPSPWTFGFIPYVLTRVKKKINRPAAPGADYQAKGETWVVSISEDPVWLECLQRWQQAREIMALASSPDALALVGPALNGMKAIAALPGSATVEGEIVEPMTPTQAKDVLQPPVDNWRSPIYRDISAHMGRLQMSPEEGRQYLKSTYGVTSCKELSDPDLNDFRDLLKHAKVKPYGSQPAEPVDERQVIMESIDGLLHELGWETAEARKQLKEKFGTTSRSKLTDEQLIEFHDYLYGQTYPEPESDSPQSEQAEEEVWDVEEGEQEAIDYQE